jgi:hypothetical protein
MFEQYQSRSLYSYFDAMTEHIGNGKGKRTFNRGSSQRG